MMTIPQLLEQMVRHKGSDTFLSVGIRPAIKINGKLESFGEKPLTVEDTLALVRSTMDEEKFAEYIKTREANYAIQFDNLGRFRCSAFFQQEKPGIVIRRIETRIPTAEELYLPPILKEVVMAKRGLFLFVGATGSGKSTSQAALIGHRNAHSSGHIITIEDPIEYVHEHGRSIITQREVGADTESFDVALKNTLRQAPDVILIGEIRSRETMEYALQFSETGHLCMATLHANNANQALERILHLVPEDMQRQFLFDISQNLRAIVAQQLIPTLDGRGRRGAFEVLINTPLVSDIIRKNELHRLKEVMSKSREQGMQTFDQALFELYNQGLISYTDAMVHADSANNLRLMIKLHNESNSTSGARSLGSGLLDDVTIQED